jgi:beta-barrel assembly-enhancing protease
MNRLILIVVLSAAPASLHAQFSLVSVEDEIRIGRDADAQIRKDVPEVTDAQVTAYVRGLGRRLAAQAPGPKYPYSFSVANYREINAFALPGGPIWLHRGLMHAATNESQIAGVLAHEVAHVAQRHAADQLTKGMVANGLLGVLGAFLGNSGAASFAQAAAGLAANAMFLRFSRDDEREADQVGLQILRKAGWDARGMVELFEIIRREQGRDPGALESWISSHPSPADRIARLQADVARSHGGTRDTQQFQSIKTRLQRMPAARAMPGQ